MSIENPDKYSGPKLYSFSDGRFSFWEGGNGDEVVVIRVWEGESPSARWVEKGLPLGMTIHPASEEHIRQWLESHKELELKE